MARGQRAIGLPISAFAPAKRTVSGVRRGGVREGGRIPPGLAHLVYSAPRAPAAVR